MLCVGLIRRFRLCRRVFGRLSLIVRLRLWLGLNRRLTLRRFGFRLLFRRSSGLGLNKCFFLWRLKFRRRFAFCLNSRFFFRRLGLRLCFDFCLNSRFRLCVFMPAKQRVVLFLCGLGLAGLSSLAQS